ncbi:MAG TPA: serine/threonine-protein kinase [Anaeromyxobacter sp.]|nr:serine/threonine-protein kinase [Anaeromyxobacter sp.]
MGSFQIVKMVGRGGMGTVYLAEHPVIGSKVAVKFLHQSMAHEPEVVARFYDEARAVNLIGHENIVGVYDLSLLPPDRFYYVMEYLEGETLAALERKGRVPVATGLEILVQLCDALAAAHEQGVVHRDLKPENVFLVARRGHAHFVKLVDFGIAKLRGGGASRTQAGVLVGTPEYMAPEQCDDGTIDARTDVYALGVMAFELFTGLLPFTSRSTTQLLLAHMGKPPPRPSSIAPMDADLEAAILKALEKEPARRFQDMAELGEALRLVHQRLTAGGAAAAAPAAPAPSRTAPPAPPPAARTAAAPAPPTPAAPAPRRGSPTPPLGPAAEIEATVALPGAAPQRLPLVELTRAGLFLRSEGALPPLLARVKVTLAHASLRAPLALSAEVVRHVAAADAAAMRLAPGFALQAVDLTPEVRAALAELADLVRAPATPTRTRTAAEVDARLDTLEARAGADPYALLGVAPDVEFSAIRRAGGALRDELELLRAQPLAPAHPGRAVSLLARLDAALATVGMAAPRLTHDARTGNWRGVRRALKAGVPEALVAARRAALLEAEPARRAEAERQLARARVAQKLGNAAAAAAAFEAALRADPLDVAAHDAFEAFEAGRTV